MKVFINLSVFLLFLVIFRNFFGLNDKVYAATSPSLGTASTYSILAGSEVTNTGATTISGDVGISPGIGSPPHYTGFGTVTLGGTIHDADGAALTAVGDKDTAYTALASQGCDTDYGAVTKDLAGEILVPGVYCADSFHLTGTLTLNGSSTGVWIFKSASDLILTGGAAVQVLFTGGGLPCNVWWRVVSTATFDANSTFVGNILAGTSITMAAGASLNGRALAGTAEVTLSSNSVTGPTCSTPTPTPTVAAISSSTSTNNVATENICIADPITTVPTILETRRVSPTSIFLSWGPYAGLDRFNIRYGTINGEWLYNADFTGFSTTINDLAPNQPYWFQVAARNNCFIGTYGESKGLYSPARLGGVPGLPNTGRSAGGNNTIWFGVFGVILSSITFYLYKKKHA